MRSFREIGSNAAHGIVSRLVSELATILSLTPLRSEQLVNIIIFKISKYQTRQISMIIIDDYQKGFRSQQSM